MHILTSQGTHLVSNFDGFLLYELKQKCGQWPCLRHQIWRQVGVCLWRGTDRYGSQGLRFDGSMITTLNFRCHLFPHG